MYHLLPSKLARYLPKSQPLFLSIFALVWLLLMAVHGLLPGMVGVMTTHLSRLGSIECGSQGVRMLLHARCAEIGGDAGAYLTLGLPFTFAGAVMV